MRINFSISRVKRRECIISKKSQFSGPIKKYVYTIDINCKIKNQILLPQL